MKYILISKDSSEIDNIEVLEYNPDNTKYDSTEEFDKWYEDVFDKVDLDDRDYLFPVPPTNYIALYLPVTSNLPMFKYKIEVSDYSISKDANLSGRYGIAGDNYSKLKGKQSFFSFLKNKFINIYK